MVMSFASACMCLSEVKYVCYCLELNEENNNVFCDVCPFICSFVTALSEQSAEYISVTFLEIVHFITCSDLWVQFPPLII